ncbi:imidazolonepropionase [Undibacterium sp. Jales W-56]|uniref:imidazolonepropionase n=1 Tax=Undibacterium sp. Jales W-56 TaxID=2897325 RepID=UPI0021CFF6E4|nr:imidazolonepropionase [Undibacterium sp. Jales W-56]MCU6432943.1 imidazolonepropionase [Undibacterium sp. Jales W-56]
MTNVWINVHLATMADGYGEIRDAAIVAADGKIVWLGKQADLPDQYQSAIAHDGHGCWLTPGLVDCHTHIVYAGNRSDEFEARLNGVAYEEIARQGGGILSTVRATRLASAAQLRQASLPRLRNLLKEGVTTLEIKSGYGLDLETEAKILRVARQFANDFALRVQTTFLGAHALPAEYTGRADDYLELVCEQMLPALVAEGLVDAVDAFCEKIGFSPTQTEKVFQAAQRHGLPVKLHAEQLSDQGGAALTARYRGLSADHLEYLSQDGINAMAQNGTVAVLLPGAFYFLRESKLPPVAALRAAQVPIAISTDCNPGTSPMTSLLLAMNMACTLFRLTPLEALAGTTRHAARALGLQNQIGTLEVGKAADFALWAIDRPGDLAYAIGGNPCTGIVFAGVPRLG